MIEDVKALLLTILKSGLTYVYAFINKTKNVHTTAYNTFQIFQNNEKKRNSEKS